MTFTPVEAGPLGEPEQPPPRTSNVPAAVVWMIGTLLSFSLMAISIRQLGGTLNLFELLMVRAIGGLAILLVVMAAQPSLLGYLALRKPGTHLIRNGTHFIANLCWTNAVILLPLATVFATELLMTVWAEARRCYFLGEKLTIGRAGSSRSVSRRAGHPAARHRGVSTAALGVLRRVVGYAAPTCDKKLIPVQSTIAIIFG